MNRAAARTLIRANTDHEGASDTQVTDTQLDTWLDIEHKLLCREVAFIAPSLYTQLDDEQELDAGDGALEFPDDFERLVRLERQAGASWYPIDISDSLSPHTGSGLTVREEEEGLQVSPAESCAGTYRIVYLRRPLTLDDDDEEFDLPPGCEDILCERVCARARIKLDEDPTPHQSRADSAWVKQKQALRRRYGRGAEPGMRLTRRW